MVKYAVVKRDDVTEDFANTTTRADVSRERGCVCAKPAAQGLIHLCVCVSVRD